MYFHVLCCPESLRSQWVLAATAVAVQWGGWRRCRGRPPRGGTSTTGGRWRWKATAPRKRLTPLKTDLCCVVMMVCKSRVCTWSCDMRLHCSVFWTLLWSLQTMFVFPSVLVGSNLFSVAGNKYITEFSISNNTQLVLYSRVNTQYNLPCNSVVMLERQLNNMKCQNSPKLN